MNLNSNAVTFQETKFYVAQQIKSLAQFQVYGVAVNIMFMVMS